MRPLFERLVPYAVHLAISLYDDRKDSYIREQISIRKDDLDQTSTRCVQNGCMLHCDKESLDCTCS